MSVTESKSTDLGSTGLGWVPTYTGKKFSLVDPDPADVDIIDIAVHLARQPRFNGATRYHYHYSVAQHCVLASRYCELFPVLALMHDAAEAYTGDIVRPLKELLGGAIRDIEERVHRAIAHKFGIISIIPNAVHAVDLRLLATERRDLVRDSVPIEAWRDLPEPYPEHIDPWPISQALYQFLCRWQLLTNQEINFRDVPHD